MKGLDTSSHNTVENTQKVKYIAYECILNNSIFVHLIKDSDRSDSVFCRSYPSRKNVKSYDTIHKYAKHLKYVKKIVSDYFSSIEYFSSTNSQQIFFQSVMFALQNAWLLYVRDHEDVTEFNNAVSNINDFRCSVAHSLMYADASHLQE
ncbi:hypothetical protein SK128_019900 [Halocaridina rubra]|uniref:Uncharacterized protein n=1 Tax=Halocaridina rubra TaxID=373956 RepID=A0AAN8ZZM5_HALRR